MPDPRNRRNAYRMIPWNRIAAYICNYACASAAGEACENFQRDTSWNSRSRGFGLSGDLKVIEVISRDTYM